MLNVFRKSLCAGMLISIGGSAYLNCDNKYAGAVLFSVGLLAICYKEYFLFTGKVGYAAYDHSRSYITALLVGLVGNLIATVLMGRLVSFAIGAQAEAAQSLCALKLTQTTLQTFVRAVFCGMLMYLAVSIYKEKNTALGVLFCVPAFILSGFEHSIADMFYFAAAGVFTLRSLVFMLAVIAGNAAGAILLPALAGRGESKSV